MFVTYVLDCYDPAVYAVYTWVILFYDLNKFTLLIKKILEKENFIAGWNLLYNM